MSQEALYEDGHVNALPWDPDKHIIHGGRNEVLLLQNQGDYASFTLTAKIFQDDKSIGALLEATVEVLTGTDTIAIKLSLSESNTLAAYGLSRCWVVLDVDFGGTIGLRPIRQGYVVITPRGTGAPLVGDINIPQPVGVARKVAISGDPHPVYTNQLSLANNDTEVTIPGSGILVQGNMTLEIGGVTQTDFTFSGRTFSLGFTPIIDNDTRIICRYEEY